MNSITKKEINRVVKYLQNKFPDAYLETIEKAILFSVKNNDGLILFDSFEQYVNFNFGRFMLKQKMEENRRKN